MLFTFICYWKSFNACLSYLFRHIVYIIENHADAEKRVEQLGEKKFAFTTDTENDDEWKAAQTVQYFKNVTSKKNVLEMLDEVKSLPDAELATSEEDRENCE